MISLLLLDSRDDGGSLLGGLVALAVLAALCVAAFAFGGLAARVLYEAILFGWGAV